MPAILAAPWFIPALLAAGTAATVGTQLYEASQVGGGSSTPATPTPTAPTPQTPATNQAQQAAVSSALPNLQALTGGSLSPEYASQFGATQSGLGNNPAAAGNIQAAINQFFGLSAPGNTGLSPTSSGGGSILDLLSKATPGSTSVPGSSITQGILNDEFRGLAA